jgi:hypothetical protein
MAVLHGLLDALRWCEENYATLQAEPNGHWVFSATDRRTDEDVEGDPVVGFLEAYQNLRGKLDG